MIESKKGLIPFTKLGGLIMKRYNENTEKFTVRVQEWIKANRIKSIIIALVLIVVIGTATTSDEDAKTDDTKQEAKQETQEPKKEVAEETEDVETEVEDIETEDATTEIEKAETETEQPKQEGLSEEFTDNAGSYLMQLSVSYETLGLLADAEDEREMANIIKMAQSDYDETNQYFTNLDPQNDAEQKMYDKLLDIDTLASSALINAEDGLKTNDVDLINQATEDIESSAIIADTIYEDIQ